MFGKKKKGTNKIVVSTKEELKAAIKRKEPYIEVQGDLAKKMKWMGKLTPAKAAGMAALLTSVMLNPAGGAAVSAQLLVANGIMDVTAGNIAVCIIGVLGIATIIGILKGYNVEVEAGQVSLKLKAGNR